ncbi:hypothetical protein OLMES_0154 [Oleiphilus messinensis]|uniref:Uncharacterized protein n=2 Tax=Oleiphilus messinensis TaxID=141451 RepID=A0A1Y0I1E3_9GAMM|nr:hypothetical protein OLMES_0154 [Oleiphilus messinensis]
MNPELQKNIWLNLSPHRLVATPIVMILLVILVHILMNSTNLLGEVVDPILYIGIFGCLSIGGAYASAQSVLIEFAEKTWDQQRMSPLSPWALVWGKVLGGGIFWWYLTCLMLLLFIGYAPWLSGGMPWRGRFELLTFLLGCGFLCQFFSLMLVLNLANDAEQLLKYRRNMSVGVAVLAALVGGFLLDAVYFEGQESIIVWWTAIWERVSFIIISVWIFAAWAAFGTYQLMRQQMQFKNGILPWLGFNLFMLVYVPGFLMESNADHPVAAVLAFLTSIVLTYASLIINPMQTRSALGFLRSGMPLTIKQFRTRLPLWCVSFVLSFLMLLLVTIEQVLGNLEKQNSWSFLVALWLFMVRDFGLIICFLLGARPARAMAVAGVYLILLYIVLPLILQWSEQIWVMAFFWPVYESKTLVWPVLLEVCLVFTWVVLRFRQQKVVTASAA